jgi:hypothetical protein
MYESSILLTNSFIFLAVRTVHPCRYMNLRIVFPETGLLSAPGWEFGIIWQ